MLCVLALVVVVQVNFSMGIVRNTYIYSYFTPYVITYSRQTILNIISICHGLYAFNLVVLRFNEF